ncbi:MAG TPA: hypothetical protein VJW76_00130 [Verrucomicrobiae bacterium]|nr:hypothetical protein [Verrucomicrobiae bacterium]
MKRSFAILALTFVVAELEAATATNTAARLAVSPAAVRLTAASLATVASTGRLRNDRVLVPITFNKVPLHEMQVMVKEAGNFKVATNAVERSGEATNLVLQRNALYFLKEKSPIPGAAKLSTNKNYFPGVAIVTISDTQVLSAQLFLRLSKNAMRWNAGANAYTNSLTIGIDGPDTPALKSKLLPHTVLLTDAQMEMDSSRVVVTNFGTTGSHEVGLWLPRSRSEASVTAVSDFGERTVTVPVERLGVVGMIELILPIPFLFAAAIGGAIGGILRASQKKFKRWPWQICEGILVATVIVAALSAGFQLGSLTGSMVGKAVGVFAVAAICGYTGAALLDRLAKQVTNPGETREGARRRSGEGS